MENAPLPERPQPSREAVKKALGETSIVLCDEDFEPIPNTSPKSPRHYEDVTVEDGW